jgi:hypothetical protein
MPVMLAGEEEYDVRLRAMRRSEALQRPLPEEALKVVGRGRRRRIGRRGEQVENYDAA